MKVSREQLEKEFTPFNFIIKVESETDARALYAIFNHASNVQLLPNKDGNQFRAAIGEYGTTEEITNGIYYNEYYK